jgi:hypothetical protein
VRGPIEAARARFGAPPQSDTSTMPSPKKPAARPQRPSTLPPEAEPEDLGDISADVLEFMTAVDDYKRNHGRPFPNLSEILGIVQRLGYRKSKNGV